MSNVYTRQAVLLSHTDEEAALKKLYEAKLANGLSVAVLSEAQDIRATRDRQSRWGGV